MKVKLRDFYMLGTFSITEPQPQIFFSVSCRSGYPEINNPLPLPLNYWGYTYVPPRLESQKIIWKSYLLGGFKA